MTFGNVVPAALCNLILIIFVTASYDFVIIIFLVVELAFGPCDLFVEKPFPFAAQGNIYEAYTNFMSFSSGVESQSRWHDLSSVPLRLQVQFII